jgi:dimethylamine--corrinoid protein Co-methyltransferase
MRAAGDLVARMQISRGMRIVEAKAYVAERLGVSPDELSDPIAMEDVRRERQLGRITTFEISYPTESSAMEAKFNIAELLGLPINCVQRFRDRAGLMTAHGAASYRG